MNRPNRKAQENKGLLLLTIVLASVLVLSAGLVLWGGSITGYTVADKENIFCEDQAGLRFISQTEQELSRTEREQNQIYLGCIPGKISFQENSEHIDISPEGRIKLNHPTDAPQDFDAIIIAEHETGRLIHEKFKFKIR